MGESAVVVVSWVTAFLDTPAASSASVEGFWGAVTATRLSVRRGLKQQFATLLPTGGDAFLRVQVIGALVPGVHVDLHVPKVGKAKDWALALNAAVVADHGTLVVLTSPGGLPFCLVAAREERRRPTPLIWPDGHRSLVDEVCLDVPSGNFDLEARFWSSLTGWPLGRGSPPEFAYLDSPATLPLRLILQSTGDSGPLRAHWHLASDDVEAEIARHEALGAAVLQRTEARTVLREPAGRVYCIKRRDQASRCASADPAGA